MSEESETGERAPSFPQMCSPIAHRVFANKTKKCSTTFLCARVCKASTMNYRRLQESAVPTFLFLTFLPPPPATRPTLSTSFFLSSFPALMGPIMFSFLRSLLLLLLLTLFGAKNHICRRRRRAFEGWTDRGEREGREECVSV